MSDAVTTDDDLLALDTVAEAERFAALFARCAEHEDCQANGPLGDACAAERVSGETLLAFRRYVTAQRLQMCDRVHSRDDASLMTPFLLRAIVRPDDVGEISLIVEGRYEVVASVGRVHLRGPEGLLLLLGMNIQVNPRDALLLGQFLVPQKALLWYGVHGSRPEYAPLFTSQRCMAELADYALRAGIPGGVAGVPQAIVEGRL